MKKLILSLALVAVIGFTGCKNETKSVADMAINTVVIAKVEMVDLNFGVRGNCGMCKKTIEKAAHRIDGVSGANWNRDRKSINVSFDDTKTNVMAIHEAIATSGYDTEKVMGNLSAYENLPGCCKYDHNMKMNQDSEIKDDNHGH